MRSAPIYLIGMSVPPKYLKPHGKVALWPVRLLPNDGWPLSACCFLPCCIFPRRLLRHNGAANAWGSRQVF